MKTDYALTKEDVDIEINKNGYAIISTTGSYMSNKGYFFLLVKPLITMRAREACDFSYYFYGAECSAQEALRRYLEGSSSGMANCHVTWSQLVNCYNEMSIVRLTLYDLVET